MMRVIAFVTAFLIGAGGIAFADSSPVVVKNAWARATPQGAASAAAYVSVTNKGASADRLISASTPVASEAQLHTMSNDNGVMKMRPVASIDIKPGASVTLKPGGFHVMLTGLKQPLTEGQTFPLALIFEKAGTIETTVRVAKVGAMSGMDMSRGTTKMQDMPGMGTK